MILINARVDQLKLCLPLGLSQAAVRSRRPFASFHASRLSDQGRGASGASPGRTPCVHSGGQMAVKLAKPPSAEDSALAVDSAGENGENRDNVGDI